MESVFSDVVADLANVARSADDQPVERVEMGFDERLGVSEDIFGEG